MDRIQNKLEGQRLFPVGSRVHIREGVASYERMKETFNKYETRGYMIVTDHSADGWLKFDNIEYTRRGGSWNPHRFKIIKVEMLPEELFEV